MPVLKDALVAALISHAARPKRRADMAGLGLLVLSGLVAFLALIYAALGLFTWLDTLYTAQAAFAIVAAGLAALALGAGWCGLRILRRRERDVGGDARRELRALVDMLADDVLPGVIEPVAANPKTALAAAVLAGFLTGEKIH